MSVLIGVIVGFYIAIALTTALASYEDLRNIDYDKVLRLLLQSLQESAGQLSYTKL